MGRAYAFVKRVVQRPYEFGCGAAMGEEEARGLVGNAVRSRVVLYGTLSCCGGICCICCESQFKIVSPLAVVAIWFCATKVSFQSGRRCQVRSNWCVCSSVAWCGRCAERMCIWLPVLVCRVAAMLAAAAVGVSMCVMSGALKAMPVPLHSVSSLCAKTVHLCSLQHWRPASSRMTS